MHNLASFLFCISPKLHIVWPQSVVVFFVSAGELTLQYAIGEVSFVPDARLLHSVVYLKTKQNKYFNKANIINQYRFLTGGMRCSIGVHLK